MDSLRNRKKALRREKEELRGTIRVLKECLVEAHQLIGGKQVEIERLMRMIRGLKKGEEKPRVEEMLSVLDPGQAQAVASVGGRRAEEIFPEEVWEKILLKLEAAVDLWNVYNASPLFRRILFPNKNVWHFELAFQILFPYLKKSSVLKCRSVCKRWNKVVDEHYEKNPPLSSREGPHYKVTFERGTECLGELGFVEEMKDHPRNPIIGRSLHIFDDQLSPENTDEAQRRDYWILIYYNGEEEWEHPWDYHLRSFMPTVRQLLEQFGAHLWHLRYVGTPHATDEDGRTIQLFTEMVFQSCPNLKTLRLDGHLDDGGWNIAEILLYFEEHQITAPNLETVHVGKKASGPIVTSLLQLFGRQLKCLHLWIGRISLPTAADWSVNLRELYVHIHALSTGNEISSLADLQLSQLRRLGLKLVHFHDDDDIGSENEGNLESLLLLLNKLVWNSPGLKELQLEARFSEEEVARLPHGLYAPPALKCLEYSGPRYNWVPCEEDYFYLVEFAFLTRFPFLEQLNIKVENELLPSLMENWWREYCGKDPLPDTLEQLDVEEVVEVKKCMEEGMYSSNIWGIIPRMKELTLPGKKYTRKGHDQAKKTEKQNGSKGEPKAEGKPV